MNINDAWSSRSSVYNFNPNENIINTLEFRKVIDIFSSNMLSKNNEFPYGLDIIGWQNKELRNFIYAKTQSLHDLKPNPQTLAPVIITFTILDKNEIDMGLMEIGMAAMGLVQLLHAHGFKTGLCGCVNAKEEIAKKIAGKGSTYLILGIGIENRVRNPIAIDPFTDDLAYLDKAQIHPKPYPKIKFHP